ncbi:MAG: hypothetical protein J0M07_26250 [Anaerolineae bacterium]|nr:hypothetical protein [Anaerolineae bacterium]
MRTPAGKECKFYYADFNRGRNLQECRLIKANPDSLPWQPSTCTTCPVPDILYANSSPNLELQLSIRPRLLGLGRKLHLEASCVKHRIPVADPYVGCPQCNAERPGLDAFIQALEQGDNDPAKPE